MTLKTLELLAKWNEARTMVKESDAPTASPWERKQKARRVEWAAQLGAECLRRLRAGSASGANGPAPWKRAPRPWATTRVPDTRCPSFLAPLLRRFRSPGGRCPVSETPKTAPVLMDATLPEIHALASVVATAIATGEPCELTCLMPDGARRAFIVLALSREDFAALRTAIDALVGADGKEVPRV
jgi:hypothetical protein